MRRALALCLLLVACGVKEPEQEREKKTIASWEAALALAAEGWTRGELPKHFVRNAAEAATEELSKEKNAARALALARDLEDAVERDDRAAAARIAAALEKESR